ncbi:hypothetical protein [Streptomyces sp. NPDC057682]|uniref:hypothetical protein n=1 Tax=Streptomyces sp. NPDC057682 TaxID=3346210 RepID=UPI0036B72F91
MRKARPGVRSLVGAALLALCAAAVPAVPAAAAQGVTLSSRAAAAEPQSVDLSYVYGGTLNRNYYNVHITATVTRVGDQYKLSGSVTSLCNRESGPAQRWGLSFGSSAENWRYLDGSCEGDTRTERIEQSGPLGSDGRVYLQAGAYGGQLAGSWGWGEQKSVWV